jgi:hypothetical protein
VDTYTQYWVVFINSFFQLKMVIRFAFARAYPGVSDIVKDQGNYPGKIRA